ncbi:MAG TPA: hypothetical protein VLT61_17135 [Anaeromyxobacteraceae bacterium]|nr:hypothetical protein [Anaeromyxobacteraceae bacterium]
MRTLLAITVAVLGLAACGGGSTFDLENPGGLVFDGTGPAGGGGGTSTISCTYADRCEQLTGTIDAATQTSSQTACTGGAGTFGAANCSTTGSQGSCALAGSPSWTTATGTYVKYYYASGTVPWDPTTAQADCTTAGGTFTP